MSLQDGQNYGITAENYIFREKGPHRANILLDKSPKVRYTHSNFKSKGNEEKSRRREKSQRVPAGGKGYGRLL